MIPIEKFHELASELAEQILDNWKVMDEEAAQQGVLYQSADFAEFYHLLALTDLIKKTLNRYDEMPMNDFNAWRGASDV